METEETREMNRRWRRRRNKAEYWLHCLAQTGDERAERAWYELVKDQWSKPPWETEETRDE